MSDVYLTHEQYGVYGPQVESHIEAVKAVLGSGEMTLGLCLYVSASESVRYDAEDLRKLGAAFLALADEFDRINKEVSE